jgi:choline monooxygenase
METFDVNPDIKRARCLPVEFYKDESFFDISRNKIFERTWQFGGLSSDAENLLPVNLLDGFLNEPILFVNDGGFRCVSNVCTHRGNILVGKKCRKNGLRCGYHGRLFDLAGNFVSMPGFEGVEDFPDKSDDLKSVPSAEISGLLFASIYPFAEFETVFQPVLNHLGSLGKVESVSTQSYEVKAHWALYCENYLEGFHIPYVHGGLNKEIDFGSYSTTLFRYSSLQTGAGSEASAGSSFEDGTAAYYYFVFPNLMFNFYPWGLSMNSVEPITKESTRVRYLTVVTDKSNRGRGAGGDLGSVEMEDQKIVESVQRGISARLYEPGRYSVQHEKGTHHFHRLIAEFMNYRQQL